MSTLRDLMLKYGTLKDTATDTLVELNEGELQALIAEHNAPLTAELGRLDRVRISQCNNIIRLMSDGADMAAKLKAISELPTTWVEGEYYINKNDLVANSPQEDGMVALSLNNTELQKRVALLEDLLSSAYNIANRNGENTLWERFAGQLHVHGISPITAKTFKILPSDTEISAYKPLVNDVRKDAETAWLVEKDIGGFPNYLYCDCIGLLSWTPSNQKAMRFARREDAESIVSIVEDADRVAQHMWLSAINKARG